jgi:hypothetical protein
LLGRHCSSKKTKFIDNVIEPNIWFNPIYQSNLI